MAVYALSQLNGRLERVATVTTAEIERDEASVLGLYVFRDEAGAKFMWSPRPERYQFEHVGTVAEADMVMFLCPLCFEKNGGAKGTHSVMVSFAGRNIPEDAGSINAEGKPSRWEASGTTLSDLVLTPSIQIGGACQWHGFVGSSGIPAGHAG